MDEYGQYLPWVTGGLGALAGSFIPGVGTYMGAGIGTALGKYALGQHELSKPTPYKPQWQDDETRAMLSAYEKKLKGEEEYSVGKAKEDITQDLASRGIESSGILASNIGNARMEYGQQRIGKMSDAEMQLREHYMQNKEAWQGAERARGLAKDQLTSDLFNDVIGSLGITGLNKQGLDAIKAQKLATKGTDISMAMKTFAIMHPELPVGITPAMFEGDINPFPKLTFAEWEKLKTDWANIMQAGNYDYTKYGKTYQYGGE